MKRWLTVLAAGVAVALGIHGVSEPGRVGGGHGSGNVTKPAAASCYNSAEPTCGYPNATNTGPANEATAKCASYPTRPYETVSESNKTYEHIYWHFGLVLTGNNDTFKEVCVRAAQEGKTAPGEVARAMVWTGTGTLTIEHSALFGLGTGNTEAIESALETTGGKGTELVMNYDYVTNCATCVKNQGGQTWSIKNSFVYANALLYPANHLEAVYLNNPTATFEHDTVFNSFKQTAAIFSENYAGPCEQTITIANSLLAGGDETIYWCSHAVSNTKAHHIKMENNRIARCKTQAGESGTHFSWCTGGTEAEPEKGSDVFGFFPNGGSFGPIDNEGFPAETFTGNVWDNNGEAVPE